MSNQTRLIRHRWRSLGLLTALLSAASITFAQENCRDEHTNYGTPFVWKNPLRTELVISGRNQVRSYDLAGKVLWHFKGMSTLAIPTPFEADGLLYLAAGYVGDKQTPNKPVYVVRPGGEGDLRTLSHVYCVKARAP